MKTIACVLLGSLCAAPAFATEAGAGYVTFDAGGAGLRGADFGGPGGNLTFPNRGTLQFGGGYRYTENFAVEGGLVAVGRSTIDSFPLGVPMSETLTGGALYVAAVGIIPINPRFELFGKLGLARTRFDYNSNAFPAATAARTNLMAGLGGQININRAWGVRLQFQHFGRADFGAGALPRGTPATVRLNTFTVGGIYSF
jgi:OOP family OmpA-OmpF porin